MRQVKIIFSIVLVIFLVVYFLPMIIEGLKPGTEELRRKAKDIKTLKVFNQTMAYKEYGEGFPVIMIHGFSYSTLCWERNIEPLVKAGFKVYAVDLFGHGLSDKPENFDYSLPFELFADQVNQFMTGLKIKKADIIGHSLGGGTAVRLTCKYPDRINRIVLVASAGLPFIKKSNLLYKLMRIPVIGEFLRSLDFKIIVRRSLSKMTFNDKFPITDEYMEKYTAPAGTKGYTRTFLGIIRADRSTKGGRNDLTECLKNIKVPALIIHGDEDRLVSVQNGRKIHSLLKGSAYHEIKQEPHSLMETDPKIVNKLIIEFLTK